MPQYFISVLHDPGVQQAGTVYADEAAVEAAFARVGDFNDSLGERLLFAGGLTAPEQAVVVTPDADPTPGPTDPDARKPLGGFWIIEADDDSDAQQITTRAAQACGQMLELRRLEG